MLLFLYYSLLNVGYGKTIWVRQGETAVVRCKKPGQMVRFEEPGQVLALKFNSSKPQMIAPKLTFWELDDSNSVGSQVLAIRMNDMQLEKETDLTCSDEDGNIEYYKVKMLIPPKVTASLNSKATLAEGEELKASCSAKGGQPNVSISWSNTVDDESYSVGDGEMVSNISYTVSSTFHRQRFRCHVSQNGETTIYDLDEVYVEYKPTVVNLTINKEVNENEALDTPNCQANSYPAAKINYQISGDNGITWVNFDPKTTISLDKADNLVRCLAQNSRGSATSDSVKLKVFPAPSDSPMTSSTTTTSTTSLKNPKISDNSAGTNGSDDVNSEAALANQVEKSGKNGIILSVIGSGAFIVIVLFGWILRKFVKRSEGETYKTDEISDLEEGISLHDPELEAHKKKEYFM